MASVIITYSPPIDTLEITKVECQNGEFKPSIICANKANIKSASTALSLFSQHKYKFENT